MNPFLLYILVSSIHHAIFSIITLYIIWSKFKAIWFKFRHKYFEMSRDVILEAARVSRFVRKRGAGRKLNADTSMLISNFAVNSQFIKQYLLLVSKLCSIQYIIGIHFIICEQISKSINVSYYYIQETNVFVVYLDLERRIDF